MREQRRGGEERTERGRGREVRREEGREGEWRRRKEEGRKRTGKRGVGSLTMICIGARTALLHAARAAAAAEGCLPAACSLSQYLHARLLSDGP
jgi:hypothetical protein